MVDTGWLATCVGIKQISGMITRILPAENPDSIRIAVSLIIDGSIVAFPTDTVYGLGASAYDSKAIDQLFRVKNRQVDKAIAVLVGSPADIKGVSVDAGSNVLTLIRHFWPGALTLVVKRHPSLPKNISPTGTIGIRMPDHPIALRILQLTGPLAVTSANLSGNPDSVTANDVFKQLRNKIPLIIDAGSTPGGSPSTVIDCTGEEIVVLREGPITFNQLKLFLK